MSKSRLASWNLVDSELLERVYGILVDNLHEPFNARAVAEILRNEGFNIVPERIAHLVKDDNRIKHKHLCPQSKYQMLVFWV